MTERNWYYDGRRHYDDLYVRSISYDLTLYEEIADLYEAKGTDDAIDSWVALKEVIQAADEWFKQHPEEPYGIVNLLLTRKEIDAVADAENKWFSIPGNSERQEDLWHQEYLARLGGAITTLSEAGYVATGNASRHEMKFDILASHPFLMGEEGAAIVAEKLWYKERPPVYGFNSTLHDNGLVTVSYNCCPPGEEFEPVVAQLASITSK